MAFLQFPSAPKKDNPPRWFGGISISSGGRRIESAVIGSHGRGGGSPIEIRKTISFDLPPEITSAYIELQRICSSDNAPIGVFFSLYQHVLRELASVEEEAIGELLSDAHLSKNDVLAFGVKDSGLFHRHQSQQGNFLSYQSLCDAPYLAEQTGLNIIDAFPEQDVASNGRGGPLLPLPMWVFLKSDTADRILIDLGATARIIFLPRAENVFSHQRILYRDIIPCGSLLDSLTRSLTQGKMSIDNGGKLTVQGCQLPELLDALRAVQSERQRTSKTQTSNWNPLGISPSPFLEVLAHRNTSEYTVQDILCTANAFIAECVADAILNMFSETERETENNDSKNTEPELLITGSGQLHGLLVNLLSSHLNKRPIMPIARLGFSSDCFDAVNTAMLTLMAADQIPSNLPSLTGSDTSRPLGRITSGSAAAWQRLLNEMTLSKPAARNLRSAV